MTESKRRAAAGYISVDRDQALKENWDLIQRMKRPAQPEGSPMANPKPPALAVFTVEDFKSPDVPWTSYLSPARASTIANSKVAPLVEERDAANTELERLREKIISERLTANNLLFNLTAESDKLRAGWNEASERNISLQTELIAAKAENRRLQIKVSDAAIDTLNNDPGKLKTDNQKLRAENQDLELKNKGLRARVAEQATVVAELSTKVDELEKDNQARQKHYDDTVEQLMKTREALDWAHSVVGFVRRMGYCERSGTELGQLVAKYMEAHDALSSANASDVSPSVATRQSAGQSTKP